MITPTMMYWLITLDSFICAVSMLLAVSIVGSIITLVLAGNKVVSWRVPTSLGVTALIVLLALVFVPSTKQMAAILIVPKIANSEKVQTVGNELYNLAVQWMEELRPAKPKGAENGRK